MSSPTASPVVQDSVSPGTVECRVWPRHPCAVQVQCQPAAARQDKEQIWQGTVRDLSRGGVGLILPRRFEPGTVLFVELPGSEARPLLVRVAHTVRLPRGTWLLGCAFSSKLSEEELQRWLRPKTGQEPPAPAGPAADPSGRGAMIPGVTLEGPRGAGGRVVRRTVRWLKLPGAWPPEAGTLLSVGAQGRVVNPAGDRVRVLGCATTDDGGWVLHYEFAGHPSPEVLRLLGYREEGR
jgi:hypothetical protein